MMSSAVISIPIKDGITEGGAIIIVICAVIVSLLVAAIVFVWRFGALIVSNINAARADTASVKEDVAKTTESINNNHDKHLRDDLDEQFAKIHEAIANVVSNVNNRFDRMNDRVTSVDKRLTGIDTRLNEGSRK